MPINLKNIEQKVGAVIVSRRPPRLPGKAIKEIWERVDCSFNK